MQPTGWNPWKKWFIRVPGVLAMIVWALFFSDPFFTLTTRAQPIVIHPLVILHSAPKPSAAWSNRGAASYPVQPEQIELRATSYNSLESQTDSDPHITATGEGTDYGVVAASRDLVCVTCLLPYGTEFRVLSVEDWPGATCGATVEMLQTFIDRSPRRAFGHFYVADTMHPRKKMQIDFWSARLAEAKKFGVCRIVIEKVRHGYGQRYWAYAPK